MKIRSNASQIGLRRASDASPACVLGFFGYRRFLAQFRLSLEKSIDGAECR
jgi:hypothetical protein